jgi:hypothetical protein
MNPQTPDNEVARLRELLNRNGDELNTFHHTKEEAFAHAEKAMPLWESVVIKRNTSDGLLFLGGWKVTTSGKLATAPEEAVIKESLTTEPAPEWRIRAEGERIEPLEKELDYLTKEASVAAADIHNHVLIVDCLRYLRDEIEQLKKNQK